MSTYAASTDVSSDKSMAEIRRTLQRYGAEQFMWGETANQAIIGFVMSARQVRFVLAMPDRNAREFTHTPSRSQRRSDTQRKAAYEQAVRQRWRALNLVIKAKLEAVQAGIADFQTEFLGHLVLPGGQTVAEAVAADVCDAYLTNQPPVLLTGLKAIEA